MFELTILLPPRKIDIRRSSEVVRYLLQLSPLQKEISQFEVISTQPLRIHMFAKNTPIVVQQLPNGVLHFGVQVTELPETQAILLQSKLWNQRVGLNLVYPYPMKSSPDKVMFTVSGGLPGTKISKKDLDMFVFELIETCHFVLKGMYDLGPGMPSSPPQPGWIAQEVQRESQGPRSSEFVIEKPVSENPDNSAVSANPDNVETVSVPCNVCNAGVDVPKAVMDRTPAGARFLAFCPEHSPKKIEDPADDHQG